MIPSGKSGFVNVAEITTLLVQMDSSSMPCASRKRSEPPHVLTKDLSPSNAGHGPTLWPVMELIGHPSSGFSGTGLIRAYLAA